MTAKKRKPLDDALAHEFVYGESALRENLPNQETVDSDTQSETQPILEQQPILPISPISAPQPAKFNLMSQLQQPSKEPTIRLTVDLPESMHRKLSVLAAKTSRKKVEIVRLLLDEALKDVEE
ncbi:CopG family transcriptional regulator [Nostoc sp. 'Lobaria pulmonaria (5183) cyanobiont']|uniref:CopG family transcriptional regulator n=1 Tax=Nostoc sp. 'Lobaria pulmonaria (5183) cyanobiont' TaxID=1618022 RepID=UPI000CF32D5B|nr:CopG family transcriptional regulator [Nostoc sp. 'Lobaria pulmonaria (5183) cyanobiont']AVH74447.1 CopG family transcriptional regulator [Nostoc sp. 'Lobaria pulmonaria (5183) cyanobiont']